MLVLIDAVDLSYEGSELLLRLLFKLGLGNLVGGQFRLKQFNLPLVLIDCFLQLDHLFHLILDVRGVMDGQLVVRVDSKRRLADRDPFLLCGTEISLRLSFCLDSRLFRAGLFANFAVREVLNGSLAIS